MDYSPKILVIEDNPDEREGLALLLRGYNFEPIEAPTGRDSLTLVEKETPDLIILDLGLPDMTWPEVFKQLKERTKAPVIILSCISDPEVIAEAQNAGAVDFMTKPASIKVLVSKLNHILVEHSGKKKPVPFRTGNLEIDFESQIVKVKGKTIELTDMEYRVLELLSKNPGIVLKFDYIMEHIWKLKFCESKESIKETIYHIRKKIGDCNSNPQIIESIFNSGFRMNVLS